MPDVIIPADGGIAVSTRSKPVRFIAAALVPNDGDSAALARALNREAAIYLRQDDGDGRPPWMRLACAPNWLPHDGEPRAITAFVAPPGARLFTRSVGNVDGCRLLLRFEEIAS